MDEMGQFFKLKVVPILMYRVSVGLSPFRGVPRGWGYLHGELE